MKNDLISIIIPIYNAEKYLSRCLKSVINQTYKNIEIILINDGSTDKSLIICKEYESLDGRIILINKENRGVSSARNEGIRKSKGKYICFIDSDDTIERNMIEVLNSNMEKYNVDLSMCGYNLINNSRKINKTYKSVMLLNKEDFYLNNNIYQGFCWNKMFKKCIAQKVKFNENVHICEDELFVIQYAELCNSFFYDSQALYNYYANPNGYSYLFAYDEKKVTVLETKELELNILKKYDLMIYKDFYLSYFHYMNDIYHKYNKDIIDKEKLKQCYEKIFKSGCYNIKTKIKVFIKYKMYWIYKFKIYVQTVDGERN